MGRTARAGKEGKVITFLTRDEYEDFQRIDGHFSGKITQYDLGDFQPRSVTMPRRTDQGGGFRDAGRDRRGGNRYGGAPREQFGHRRDERPRTNYTPRTDTPRSDAQRADTTPQSTGSRPPRRRGGRGRGTTDTGRPHESERSFYGTKN